MTEQKSQIETLKTVSADPRFVLKVNAVRVKVTRLGVTDDGEVVVEVASPTPENLRDVWPQDTGYIKDGELWVRRDEYDDETDTITSTRWEYAGDVEYSLYCPGNSVSAELAQKASDVKRCGS